MKKRNNVNNSNYSLTSRPPTEVRIPLQMLRNWNTYTAAVIRTAVITVLFSNCLFFFSFFFYNNKHRNNNNGNNFQRVSSLRKRWKVKRSQTENVCVSKCWRIYIFSTSQKKGWCIKVNFSRLISVARSEWVNVFLKVQLSEKVKTFCTDGQYKLFQVPSDENKCWSKKYLQNGWKLHFPKKWHHQLASFVKCCVTN